MNKWEQMNQALGMDNPPSTDDEFEASRIEGIRHQFEWKSRLVGGYAYQADRTEENLAFEALDHLATLLRLGKPTQPMMDMLAKYLTSHIINCNSKAAFDILCAQRPSKPRKDLERVNTIVVYEAAINANYTQEQAEQLAWSTYFPDRKYSEYAKRPADEGTTYANQAEQTMDTVIRKILRTAGVLERKKAGRKPQK